AAPQHVKIHLYNAKQVLRWDPSFPSNDSRPVVYRVQYKYTIGQWHDVTLEHPGVNCTKITATICDFTAGPSKGFLPHFNVSLQVRAELGELTSSWVTVPWFQHYRNVSVGPPRSISVTPGKGSLIIYLSPPFDIFNSKANFLYYVHYWEKTGTQQARVKGPFRNNSIVLDNLKPFTVYCLQVKAQLLWRQENLSRPGNLSDTSCYKTIADASTKLQRDIMISLGTFSALLVLAGSCFFLFQKYRGLVKYWFHTPPSIPVKIEEYLKDPAQPILEALDKDSSPKDDAWDSVSIISFPEEEQEDVLQTL
uniref:Interferon gamma receptor 2 n=1 Tax=Jaculus jaculus TaxID=51337 RepID=A0A8C5JU97_JACJA